MIENVVTFLTKTDPVNEDTSANMAAPVVDQRARVNYVNYRGEEDVRIVTPIKIYWGSNEWHKEPQWLLNVYDHGKKAEREFAMSGIKLWVPANKSYQS